MSPGEVEEFERYLASGGVAVFPADTVYGLAADPCSEAAVDRLYRLKGRPPDRPAAVMFFGLDAALEDLPELDAALRGAVLRLLPGPLTLVLPNPAGRYPLACGPEPERLGLRVPELEGVLSPLSAVGGPVLQSSANRSGGRDARRLADVDPHVARGADVVLDGGELPGTPSTVVDLCGYARDGSFAVLREGAVPAEDVRAALLG